MIATIEFPSVLEKIRGLVLEHKKHYSHPPTIVLLSRYLYELVKIEYEDTFKTPVFSNIAYFGVRIIRDDSQPYNLLEVL